VLRLQASAVCGVPTSVGTVVEAGTVPLRCITNFDLPDEEQLSLL
jgi:hypothetical protein